MGLVYFRINGALNAIPMAPLGHEDRVCTFCNNGCLAQMVDWVNLTFGNNVLI